MESRGPEDSKNVKTSQAYFFEGFISFFEEFFLPDYKEEINFHYNILLRELKLTTESTFAREGTNKLCEDHLLSL